MMRKDTCIPVFTAAPNNSQDMEATYMPINRGMDKENAIYVYNGILLSH